MILVVLNISYLHKLRVNLPVKSDSNTQLIFIYQSEAQNRQIQVTFGRYHI